MIRIIIIIICVLLQIDLYSQNIIANCSFENTVTGCEEKKITLKNIAGWKVITAKNYNIYDYVKIYSDVNKARTGISYVTIMLPAHLHFSGASGFTGYLQYQLTELLEKGKEYFLRFYFKTDYPNAKDTWIQMSVFFSDDKIESVYDIKSRSYKPIYSTYTNKEINKSQWLTVEGNFIADGNEKYLILGSYYDKTINRKEYFNKNIYYMLPIYRIDDFCLIEINNTDNIYDCSCDNENEIKLDELSTGESFILNDIFFETDRSDLLPESHNSLNKLADQMEQYPSVKIEISGHTDNTGTEEYNQKLSESRAFEVMSYLLKKGIDMDRMEYKGYGSTKPVADNSTEEGRQQNRRVEITVVEK